MTFDEWIKDNTDITSDDLEAVWKAGYAEGKKESEKRLMNCWNCRHWFCDDYGNDQCGAAHSNFNCNEERAWEMKEGL